MDSPALAIFDDGLGRFGPLTRTRPIFTQQSGAVSLRQRIERVLGRPASAFNVPDPLANVTAAHEPKTKVNQPLKEGPWLLVNGRWPGLSQAEAVQSLPHGAALTTSDGQLLAAHLDAPQANAWLEGWKTSPPQEATARTVEANLMTRPWHLLDQLPAMLEADLTAITLGSADYHQLREVNVFGLHRIYAGEGVRIQPGAILNCESGPIAIDHGAHIHPRALIEGPCYIGPHSEIMGHGYIRPNTAIGPVCKVGGEVVGSIIQGYTNKAHAGFMGDSLVGRFCNLGADTVVSNLKNTYGSVRLQLTADGEPEDTGRQRHGPIVGDFVRTAIGTRLLTGAVVDVGCMLAMSTFAPKHAGPLGFYTDQGRAEHDLDKLLQTVSTMTTRRGITLSEAEATLLRHLAEG
jgi:UDP-N-acetylglucosamine diphosphorylase/glucosamine-1-phosphate N-acetyltransferase